MTAKVSELLTSALALSPAEREELADCLWSSLDPTDALAILTEDEWVAELDRRAAELKANLSLGVPWNEVQNMQ
jgi:putative addiction module component (TIGR02574 family)